MSNYKEWLKLILCITLALISLPAYSQNTHAATVKIAEWKFDEGSGKTTKEAVGNTNNAINYVFNNAVYKPSSDPLWRADGISNNALLFDGYSNWVTHNSISTPSSAMTIETWVAPRAYEWGDNGVVSAIVNQQDKPAKQGFMLGVFRGGTWTFQIGSNGSWYEVWAYEPLPKYEWSHLVATFDGTQGAMKLYLNGQEVAARSVPINSTITPSANQLLIGKNNQSTQLGVFPLNMYNGLIDELKISSGAYSAAEAQSSFQSYLTQLGGNPPTPNLTFDRSVYDGDKYRPIYHAIAPGHWMNEPHAPLYYNGQYHLFYQNNQHGPYWHNMHWGHWVSDDMVHWRDLPPAISPELFQVDPDGVWSGSAVVDDSGNPTLFFTAGNDSKPYMNSNQNVGLARSTVQQDGDNDLKNWVKESKLAVTQQPGQGKLGEFRDPYVFKDGSTWFMLMGTGTDSQGGTAAVYSTTDPQLMNWTYRGPLYTSNPAAYPYLGQVWELPVLLPLGNGKHLLAISPVGSGANVEVYYWIGSWNSTTAKFIPDQPTPQLMDFGDFKFTGPSAFVDPVTGRNIMFTIAQGERSSQEEFDSGWAHNAGLPVELSLRSDGKLGIDPIDELQSLRGQQLVNITSDTSFASANSVLSAISGDNLEIEMELARGTADQVGIKVRKSPNSEEETLLYYKNSTDEFGVNRTKTVAGTNKGIQTGTVDIGSENVKLHIYLDKSMVEAYLNGLKSITTRIYSTREDANGLQLWGDANTSSIVVKSLKVWRMNSAYTQVPATGLNLSPESVQVSVGGKNRLYGTVTPSNTSNKNLIWSSSNPSVATVVNGVVTGKSIGTATITATTRVGAKTDTAQVIVVAAPTSTNLTNGGFESGNLSGWIVESGTAFSNSSVTSDTVFSGSQPYNHKGFYHLLGSKQGEAPVGVLKSQNFTLGGNGQISFLAGGGSDIDKLYVSFVRASDGNELFRSTGPGTYWNWQSTKGETESYTRRYWDATDYIGTTMYIKVVDERTDAWGHINVDDFLVPVQGGTADTSAPSAPANLQSPTKSSTSVTLNWSASTDNVGVNGYFIFRNGIQVGNSTTTNYTDTGLTASTAYTYTVKATDAAGNLSTASNSVAVTTDVAPPEGITNHDFESGNLTGWTIVSGNAFIAADVTTDLNWGWGGPFNQNGSYHLWGFKDGGDSQVGVLKSETFTLGGNGTIDFLIGGGNDINNLYVALVRASDGVELMKATGSNNEAYSRVTWNAAAYIGTAGYIKIVDSSTGGFGHLNVDDVNVPSGGTPDTSAPTAPTNLQSPSKTSTSVTLSWTASTDNVGVTGYSIFRNGTQVGSSTTTSYTDTGLTASTAYTYTVKATDAAGNLSAASNSVPVMTDASSSGGIINHDFESGNLTGWTVVSGNAFSAADVTTDVNWGWGGPFNQNGSYHLWGFKDGGDGQVGVLKSETFTLGGNGTIDFLIGGGNDINNLYVALVRASDGVELMKATGSANEAYSRVTWNAATYVGTTGYIKIVDNSSGGFGHINVDDVNVPTGGTPDTSAPTAPASLQSPTKTSTSVTLNWIAATDNVSVTGYSIFRNGSQVGSSSTTSFTDTGLSASTTYTYTVKATDAVGNLSAASNNVTVTTNASGITNHDFESGNLTGWTVVSGNAFSAADVTTDVNWGWGGPFNQNGSYHLWGFKDGGDSLVGVLKSETFTLGGNGSIDFLIGGGNDINNLYVALVRASDGMELMKATGSAIEAYSRITWNASAYVGAACYIKIVDNATGSFGHINVDDVNVPTL
ncbi:GH32 C-terminal domain-containing protein [Cohnella sp. GCM10027633]|uniref:GH32 C-terminal domain-containing protein n=1 Tax=unclassified Cohnella TaxID=2636738 RepID=UPI0036385363